MTPVPFCLDVPEAVRPRLLYAAGELLRPLAAAPVAVARGDLPAAGVYVGAAPEGAPEGSVRIRHRPETTEALLAERAVPPEAAARSASGAAFPFPLGRGRRAMDLPAAPVAETDVLASAFWWLAGVQERASPERDRYGRFPYAASMQHATGRPLATPVDELRLWLVGALAARGLALPLRGWGGKPWAIALTHDLDATRTRRLRALAGDLAKGRLTRGLWRAVGPDARRESAEVLVHLARRRAVRSTLFAKAGASGPEDVRAEAERDGPWLAALAEDGFEVGLHPSMEASGDGARLAAERQRLAEATGRTPAAVRSHYLRWDPAVTPALYAAEGFAVDSTLGWSAEVGFRRGTAHPFKLWDPAAGAPSALWEAPLALMDTTLFAHAGLSPEAAAARVDEAFAAARMAGGLAVVLWHNAMDDLGLWRERLDVLDHALGRARPNGAAVLTLGDALAFARGRSS